MIGTFFRLVGKAMRMAINRPIQRFNIFNRVKKHLGEDSKYFMPAPRAIGPQSLRVGRPPQYPHLEGGSGFKSIKQRRLDAIAERNQRLLSEARDVNATTNQSSSQENEPVEERKSFSETINDDDLVISTSNKLPVIKTVTRVESVPKRDDEESGETPAQGDLVAQDKPKRPLPTSTNLQLSDPAVIWHVDKVPPGRLDLSKLQELLVNKLADDAFWTSKKISETYNIKEEYAENLITYFKQIRIIISPRMATALDYVARTDSAYQATKHIIYQVDKSLRSEFDKQSDKTFLPTDELEPRVRELLDADALMAHEPPHSRLANLIRRPQPLRIERASEPAQLEAPNEDSKPPETNSRPSKRSKGPLNLGQSTTDSREKADSIENARGDRPR